MDVNIDISPDTLDLTSVAREELITAYIELPKSYNPKDIDVSTLHLAKNIPAQKRLIDIVDHDRDGVFELMVKFERRLVADHLRDYLRKTKKVEGRVSLSLTGVIDGKRFEGTDTIFVTLKAQSRMTSNPNMEDK